MFNLSDQLCERYSSLNPFIIRREKSGEVFLLINRIIDMKNLEETEIKTTLPTQKGDTHIVKPNGDVIIRREAKNDDWY